MIHPKDSDYLRILVMLKLISSLFYPEISWNKGVKKQKGWF